MPAAGFAYTTSLVLMVIRTLREIAAQLLGISAAAVMPEKRIPVPSTLYAAITQM
jgi:hypothetical protein